MRGEFGASRRTAHRGWRVRGPEVLPDRAAGDPQVSGEAANRAASAVEFIELFHCPTPHPGLDLLRTAAKFCRRHSRGVGQFLAGDRGSI